jgi:hypothetical protein
MLYGYSKHLTYELGLLGAVPHNVIFQIQLYKHLRYDIWTAHKMKSKQYDELLPYVIMLP